MLATEREQAGVVVELARKGALENEELLSQGILLILLLQQVSEATERERPAIATAQSRAVSAQ